MEATAFRDGAGRMGCVMALGSLFIDGTLWHVVLQGATASWPCPLSHSGDYQVGTAMAVAAVPQDGSGLGAVTRWWIGYHSVVSLSVLARCSWLQARWHMVGSSPGFLFVVHQSCLGA